MRWAAISRTQGLRRSNFRAAGAPHSRSADNFAILLKECEGGLPDLMRGNGTPVPSAEEIVSLR